MERKIIIGLVTSTDFLNKITKVFDQQYIQSVAARHIACWCLEYYQKYNKAPGEEIEQIYAEKRLTLQTDIQEEIGEDILPSLSAEYVRDKGVSPYLFDQAVKYLQEQQLKQHMEQVTLLFDKGEHDKAIALQNEFIPIKIEEGNTLQFDDEVLSKRIKEAFNKDLQSVLTYPGALGEMLNEQLIRSGFVAFLAPEKRGKTYLMMELANTALRQNNKVAFIQAGDMTERDFLRREGIYLSGINIKENSCKNRYKPIRDCLLNQLDRCDRKERECDFGVFDGGKTPQQVRQELTRDDYIEALENNPDYLPCRNCPLYKDQGALWYEKLPDVEPLSVKQALLCTKNFMKKRGKNLRLSTYANSTLSVFDLHNLLADWKRQDGWVPDVIIIDYADLLVPGVKLDYRHQQNHIWKELRRISQETNALVITATQADADSYKRDTISLSNFSEDKRKFAHATAFYGLNQDKDGREKALGVLRINELLIREGGIQSGKQVCILQCLDIGRPYLGSFFI